MKLVVDMNLSPHWIALLTDAGLHATFDIEAILDSKVSPILSRLGVDQCEWVRTVVDYSW